MAAHPQLSADDAAEMVKYILNLAAAKPKVQSLPVNGRYTVKLPADDKGKGMFIFRAAYKDRGANGLPGISSEETFTLRSPNVNPSDFDEFSDVNKMSFGGNRFVIPTKSGSYIVLKNIDLNNLSQVEVGAAAPKAQLNAPGWIHRDQDGWTKWKAARQIGVRRRWWRWLWGEAVCDQPRTNAGETQPLFRLYSD